MAFFNSSQAQWSSDPAEDVFIGEGHYGRLLGKLDDGWVVSTRDYVHPNYQQYPEWEVDYRSMYFLNVDGYQTWGEYFNTADNYVSLDFSTGVIPDDPLNYPNDAGRYILRNYQIRAGVQWLIIPRLIGKTEIGYDRQEYYDERWRNAALFRVRCVYYF